MEKSGRAIMKKLVAVLLSLALVSAFVMPTFAGYVLKGNIVITNPYEAVDWDTWGAYKTQLHCHTNASDGYLTIKELVQYSYDLGYDILAVTDHGTLNQGWNNEPELIPLVRLVKYERTQLADIIPLTEEEYQSYLTGTAATTNGLVRTNGMLDVPLGIELNMATPKCDCHLTGYFSDYGQGFAGVYGDYETPSAGVAEAGGISMLSHVGEYVYPDKDSADHVGQKIDEYYVNKFARIFLDYPGSSLGMGINSATDCHTRCDRILYDQILQKTIPNGVVPWGFTFSDAHADDCLDDAFTYTLMENFTLEDFRESMVKGQFFSVARYSNGVELDGLREYPQGLDDNADITIPVPKITRITVNQDENTISVEGENFDTIVWISNGNVMKRGGTDDASLTFDVDDFSDASLFVRFYITGDGGICYSQPFVISIEGVEFTPVTVPVTHDESTALRTLVTVLDDLVFKNSVIVKLFKYFALGYGDISDLPIK